MGVGGTSSGLLGAILGALCCGKLTDRIGRRKVILTSAVIFAIGALWSGWAPGIYKLEFKVAGGGYVYGELVIE